MVWHQTPALWLGLVAVAMLMFPKLSAAAEWSDQKCQKATNKLSRKGCSLPEATVSATACGGETSGDARHRIPLATHFMQGQNGAAQILGEDQEGNMMIEFSAKVSDFAPITPYVFATFTSDEGFVSVTGNENSIVNGSNGRLNHGFLQTSKFMGVLVQEYDGRPAAQHGECMLADMLKQATPTFCPVPTFSHPDTITATIQALQGTCGQPSAMETDYNTNCRPVPNGILAFQANSGQDSYFLFNVVNIAVAEAGVAKFVLYVPAAAPLVDEGSFHAPFDTEAHYHWHGDCPGALRNGAVAKAVLTKRLDAAASGEAGLFVLQLKGG